MAGWFEHLRHMESNTKPVWEEIDHPPRASVHQNREMALHQLFELGELFQIGSKALKKLFQKDSQNSCEGSRLEGKEGWRPQSC